MAKDPNEICVNCGLTFAAHGSIYGRCPTFQDSEGYLPTAFEGSGCSYEVPKGTPAFPWGRVTDLLEARGQTAQTWYMDRLKAEVCAMKADELRAELFTEKLKHANLPADAFAWLAELLKDSSPEELLPPPSTVMSVGLRRTGTMVRFLDVSIGRPFWAHDRTWVRTSFDAAAWLCSSTDRMGSVCNFNIDPEDEWVEAMEMTI